VRAVLAAHGLGIRKRLVGEDWVAMVCGHYIDGGENVA
jgi:hypothetical protein